LKDIQKYKYVAVYIYGAMLRLKNLEAEKFSRLFKVFLEKKNRNFSKNIKRVRANNVVRCKSGPGGLNHAT
jgi:hypothetical protein